MCNICNNIKDKSYLLAESNREELRIGFIDKIDDYVVNQYYIYIVLLKMVILAIQSTIARYVEQNLNKS